MEKGVFKKGQELKGTVLLADTGLLHNDNTFSLIRGGIDTLWGQELPVILKAVAIMRFRADPSEKGPHSWRFCVVDEDGHPIAPDLEGQFTVPEQGGNVQLLASFSMAFNKYGRHSFRVAVDNSALDDWPIDVRKPEPRSPQTKLPEKEPGS